MAKILLTRHGHVDGIEPARFRGRAELPLTQVGVKQAAALAARIARHWKPAAVYTSPLQRCIVTGRHIAEVLRRDRCRSRRSWATSTYGAWRMRTHAEIERGRRRPIICGGAPLISCAFPMASLCRTWWRVPPTRCGWYWGSIPNDTVVLVGHDSVNRALLLQLVDQPLSAYWRFAQDPCALSEVDVLAGGAVRVERINDTSHLEGDLDRA